MNNLDKIAKYAKTLKVNMSYGGNSPDRVFIIDRCTYSGFTEIRLEGEEAKIAQDAEYCWKLIIEVAIVRARNEYEYSWDWKPGEVEFGHLAFYHWDIEQLTANVLAYLETHKDPKFDLVTAWKDPHPRGDVRIHPLKLEKLGRHYHYTTMEQYKDE